MRSKYTWRTQLILGIGKLLPKGEQSEQDKTEYHGYLFLH